VSEQLNVHIIEPGYGIAAWDRVLIQLWRGPATLDAAARWLKIGKAFVLEKGQSICSSLSIVESSSPPPSDKVRLALSASFDALSASMRHQIVLAEGSVARSALVRGVGLTLSNFSSSSLFLKFAVSLDEAAMTLAPDLSPAAGGEMGLKGAVRELRTRMSDIARP